MRIANIACAIVGMIFSTAAFLKTLTFKQFKNVPVGPEFFPRWLAVGLFISSLALVIQNLKKPENDEKAPTINPLDKGIQRMLLGLLTIIVSSLLWTITSFIIITPFTLFALMMIFGKRNYLWMGIISVVATAIIFCVFRFILGIEMPMGFLEM